MKRKLFTAVCFLLAAAMLPSGASAAGAGKGPKKEVGIQLYSVRSLIGVFGKSEGDYKPVLQALADMGYTFVEAASYKDGLLYGTPPQQFRRDVEATGMKVLSTHCTLNLSDKQLATGDFTEALKWWDECIAAHKAAGVEYIVVPSMRRIETLDGLATYCRYFNEVGRPLQGRRHQVRLPQPLAGSSRRSRSRDAGLHARKYRSRQSLLPDGRLLDGDGAGQSGRLLHEVSGPFPAASYQGSPRGGTGAGMSVTTPFSAMPRPPAWRTSSSRWRDRATATCCAACASASTT